MHAGEQPGQKVPLPELTLGRSRTELLFQFIEKLTVLWGKYIK